LAGGAVWALAVPAAIAAAVAKAIPVVLRFGIDLSLKSQGRADYTLRRNW
jgi:hypothetical protein